MSTPHEGGQAHAELEYIHRVIERTHRRVDPHAFHCVHWGLIVLVWFPLANWFELREQRTALGITVVAALTLGFALSALREWRLRRRPRLPGENTFVSRQILLIVYPTILAGSILSGVGPGTGFIDGSTVPVIWGLIYANMAFMMGVVYTREFLWAGACLFVGVVIALFLPTWNGFILGPFMGLGMIVPGLIAERRVQRLQAADVHTPAAV